MVFGVWRAFFAPGFCLSSFLTMTCQKLRNSHFWTGLDGSMFGDGCLGQFNLYRMGQWVHLSRKVAGRACALYVDTKDWGLITGSEVLSLLRVTALTSASVAVGPVLKVIQVCRFRCRKWRWFQGAIFEFSHLGPQNFTRNRRISISHKNAPF